MMRERKGQEARIPIAIGTESPEVKKSAEVGMSSAEVKKSEEEPNPAPDSYRDGNPYSEINKLQTANLKLLQRSSFEQTEHGSTPPPAIRT
ncbi:MAG: hypothetical protein ACHQF4_08225 [Sphingobacteriales bacterium]